MKLTDKGKKLFIKRKRAGSPGDCLLVVFLLAGFLLTFSACGEKTEDKESVVEGPKQTATGFILTNPDSFDSADTAVLVGANEEEKTLTFLNTEIGKTYTLSYDGTTRMYDKYKESISLAQVDKGAIVDITFLKDKKHLTTLQLSPKAWVYDYVERYEMDTRRGEVTIGEESFELSPYVCYWSQSRSIDEMDLNAVDVLSFSGIDSTVLCVSVDKGHGYLRLVNDEYFVDGWIEIGESQIRKITEDMLLTVAEGSYQVRISHNGNGGIKQAVINRNQETVLDIGDLEIAKPRSGMVLFSLSPSSAKLYIDGEEADASLPITLEYGLHQLIAKAEGYQTITRYIRVGQASAGIDITLDKNKEDEEESQNEDNKEQDKEDETDASADYYKVYIDAPQGAEVYLDGNYVGISPTSFKKTAGAHVITLRKGGYETRSYTIQVDEEDKDISFSFADLVSLGLTGSSNSSSLTQQLLDTLLNGNSNNN